MTHWRLEEQYEPHRFGLLITDEHIVSPGRYVGVCWDGEQWREVPVGWWAVARPGKLVEIMPDSWHKEAYDGR